MMGIEILDVEATTINNGYLFDLAEYCNEMYIRKIIF